jgi:hypothetical protein
MMTIFMEGAAVFPRLGMAAGQLNHSNYFVGCSGLWGRCSGRTVDVEPFGAQRKAQEPSSGEAPQMKKTPERLSAARSYQPATPGGLG